MGPPKVLGPPNPTSSISTITTLGALLGAFTSKRAGGLALRASSSVYRCGAGSARGSTVRSIPPAVGVGGAGWVDGGALQPTTEIRVKAAPSAAIVCLFIVSSSTSTTRQRNRSSVLLRLLLLEQVDGVPVVLHVHHRPALRIGFLQTPCPERPSATCRRPTHA